MDTVRRRLLWALGVSILLHFLLLFGAEINLPLPAEERPLTVKLEPLPRPAPPRVVKAKPKSASPQPARSGPIQEPLLPAEPEPPQASPAPETAAATPVLEPPASEPAPRSLTPLPRRITIAYAIHKGDQKFNVARMTHTWHREGTQYMLSSIAEATGLVSLFVQGTLIQVSRGEMTDDGLKPDEFWIQRGQSGNRTESASFDWSGMLLHFGKANDRKTQALTSGSQDVLSVLYQLALTAPHTGTIEISLANGRKYDRYAYRVVGEEMLDTPLGVLKTEHLARISNADEDKLDLWLAADYHYLPVRLYLVDRKGGVAEQLVTAIGSE